MAKKYPIKLAVGLLAVSFLFFLYVFSRKPDVTMVKVNNVEVLGGDIVRVSSTVTHPSGEESICEYNLKVMKSWTPDGKPGFYIPAGSKGMETKCKPF